MIKRIAKTLASFFLAFLFYVIVQIGYASLYDYQPEEIISIDPDRTASQATIEDSILTLMTWNLGYGGLGAESDFFYSDGSILLSGGKMVRPAKPVVEKNVKGIQSTIQQNPVDIFLLQETDYQSKRSYFINQHQELSKLLPNYAAIRATNYKVVFVPTPILEPWNAYGTTWSGLSTFSKFQPRQSIRYQLPGEFSWPNKLYLLDRCAAQHRYPLLNGKELIVYNIHNSAYDKDGSIKKQQMAYLREQWLKAYEEGHYLVIGGDWNQCPPNFRPNTFRPTQGTGNTSYNIPVDFLPEDWLWIYDPTVPTIRSTREVYRPNRTFVSLIDFFLISPNVKALEIKGVDLGFQFSDHQPVKVKVELLDFRGE
ncbi:MAG: endonuclease/exonuclease/phosphatase family protein [Bacteroidota bacterium]